MKKLLAPNGKPSNLNEKQYKIIRTPAFKKWFGDWEILAEAKNLSNDIKGVYKLVALNDIERFLFEISQQANNSESEKKGSIDAVGEKIVELALKLFPNSKVEDEYIPVVSKVVDDNDEPLIVWHGTKKEFTVFGKDKTKGIDIEFEKEYLYRKNTNYFHIHKKYAKTFGSKYGGFEKPYFLNIKKLKLIDNETIEDIGYWKYIYDDYVNLGFDGVYSEDGQYATLLNPNQIKLADGSNTTFNANNDDIRFNNGGNVIDFKENFNIWVDKLNSNKHLPINFTTSKSLEGVHKNSGYGDSFYIEIFDEEWNKFVKIRFSGHSVTNRNRILDEVHNPDIKLFDEIVSRALTREQKNNLKIYKSGGRTIAQTPAPKKERIYGSNINKEKSSESNTSAKQIVFDEKTIKSIKNKVDKHNKENPDKLITLSSAKAVVRRGMGAYSSSHRPTIKGGKQNSRVAWGLARLNAFIYKVKNGVSKSGKYTQDDDLIKELNIKYNIGGEISKESINNVKNDKKNYLNILNNIWSVFGIKLD